MLAACLHHAMSTDEKYKDYAAEFISKRKQVMIFISGDYIMRFCEKDDGIVIILS